jgi:hypothetical protein
MKNETKPEKREIFSEETKKWLDSIPKCDYIMGYANIGQYKKADDKILTKDKLGEIKCH